MGGGQSAYRRARHDSTEQRQQQRLQQVIAAPAGEQELDSAPPALVVPSEKISLPPPLVRQRALSDAPFFTIEVQMKNRASFGRLFYAFLDTSMQTMLYNPIVGIRARDNLSIVWILRPNPGGNNIPDPGPYTFSNAVTQGATLQTAPQGEQDAALMVLPGNDAIFTLEYDSSTRMYAISTVIQEQKAYLLPNEDDDPNPRSNIINAVLQRRPEQDLFVFRIRATDAR